LNAIKCILLILIILSLFSSCRSKVNKENNMTVDYVDINRFMGPWYVIAIIPNFMEKNAVNGIETYTLKENNKIGIEYRFRVKTAQGKEKVMHPKAYIFNTKTNSEWRVQFFWPVKFPYLVIDLAEDYHYTVIGVPNRKFVWIMARNLQLEDAEYQSILEKLKQKGYDITKIKKMPQIW
jgi:apolipoprotein D and lipocalin family protein